KKGNVNNEKTLSSYGQIALYLSEQRKDAEVQPVVDEAFAFAKSRGLAEHPIVANMLHSLFGVKLRAGDFAGAHELAIRAVALHRSLQGNDHPSTGWAVLNLGYALEAQKKYA